MRWDSNYCEHGIDAFSCPYCKDEEIKNQSVEILDLEQEVLNLKWELQRAKNELDAHKKLLEGKRLIKHLEFEESDELDAERWRALLSSQMIEVQGYAKLGSPVYQHMGLTLWSTYCFDNKDQEDSAEESTSTARDNLILYVDGVLRAKYGRV